MTKVLFRTCALTHGEEKNGHSRIMQPKAVVNSGVTAGIINLNYYRRKNIQA